MEPKRVGCTLGGLLIGLLLSCSLDAQQVPRKGPLSQRQIEQLIDLKAPDSVVAAEISEQGVGFRLTRSLVNGLRTRGAGPRTLESLSRYLLQPRLAISTRPPAPRATLQIGRSSYLTDAEGRLVLADLDPGRYDAVLRHTSFQEKRFAFNLGNGDGALEIKLIPRPAILSVDTSFSGGVFSSEIDISVYPTGQAFRSAFLPGNRYKQRVSRLELAPGRYDVEVKTPFHETWSAVVDLAPGETRRINVDLVVTTAGRERLAILNRMLLSAKTAFPRLTTSGIQLPATAREDVFYLLRDNAETRELELATPEEREGPGLGIELTVAESASQVVADPGDLRFVIRTEAMNAGSVALYRLQTNAQSRFLVLGAGLPEPTPIRLVVEQAKTAYRITPVGGLTAGEYCFFRFFKGDIYCFSVGARLQADANARLLYRECRVLFQEVGPPVLRHRECRPFQTRFAVPWSNASGESNGEWSNVVMDA